jgi:hypothetical protein
MNEQLPTRRPTGPRFVAPEAAQPIQAYRLPTVEEPEYTQLAPHAASQAEVLLRTTYKDRADGFIRATTPLAGVTGAITLVGAVTLFATPLLSFAALLWFFTGFALVWLVAYLGHLFVSPDGSTWLHTLMLWRVVQREQRFRHERFWTQYYDQQDKGQ